MNRHTEFIRKRNAKIRSDIQKAIEIFDLEATVRNFVRTKIFQKYSPDKEEIRQQVKQYVLSESQKIEVLTEVLKPLVKEIVVERITQLSEDYKESIKRTIIEKITEEI